MINCHITQGYFLLRYAEGEARLLALRGLTQPLGALQLLLSFLLLLDGFLPASSASVLRVSTASQCAQALRPAAHIATDVVVHPCDIVAEPRRQAAMAEW